MTESLATPPLTGAKFGGWGSRVAAVIIDSIPNIIVLVILTSFFGSTETTDNTASFQLTGIPALVYFVFALAWFVYNWLYLQGTKGQTVGKKVLKVAVYGLDRRPIGMGLTFARQLVHIVDALPCFIGYLWPLWDKENRTFADMIMSTRVYKV